MSFYEDASWLLIPSGIEEDIVFAQKPTSGLGDLTFTRASDATYTDSAGVVRRSPYNLLQYSEQFDNATGWSILGTRFTSSKVTGPTGTNNAYLLTEVAATDSHNVFTVTGNRPNSEAGRTYTVSAYFKAGTRRYCGIAVGIAGSGVHVFVDTTSWTITDAKRFSTNTNWVYLSSAIQADLNGFYRVSLTFRTDAALSMSASIFASNVSTSTSGEPSYLGDGSTIISTGAQLVEGTSALDYFPTTNRQDVPRIDFRNADGTLSSCGRLLLEPQRTNSIRNSSMVGAVAGTPGTFPTNWPSVNGGLTRTVVGIGTENGLPYIDVRFNGTTTGTSVDVGFEGTTSISATTGQTWTQSFYFKTITSQPNSFQIHQFEYNSGGGFVTQANQSFSPTATLQRFTWSRAITGATTAFVYPFIRMNVTNGETYDFTIRIAAPQMELGAYATTWVPTTTAAVTRLADTASKTGVSSLIGQTEGTLFVEFSTANLESYTRRVFSLSDGTNSNQINLQIQASTTTLTFAVLNGAAAQAVINTSTNFYTLGSTIKIAVAYKANDFAFYANGNQIGVDTSGTVPTCSQFRFSDPLNSNNFIGSVSQYALFPTRLTNAQLAQLTTL